MSHEELIYKIASAPAEGLDKGINAIRKIGKRQTDIESLHKNAKQYWSLLGPGLITGAADDDPAGVATYSQTGAQYGFQLLWLSLFTFPLMTLVQEMCARLALMTGRGLAGNIRINYSKKVLYLCAFLLLVANSLNIGADIGAMASAVQLIWPHMNFALLAIGFTVFSLVLQIYTSYEQYAKYLKYLVFVLFSYVASALLVKIDYGQLLYYTVVPTIIFSKDQIFLITAILGTTISPYLFFWQTNQEIEEEILNGKTSLRLRGEATDKEVKHMRIDVASGMFVSNFVMYFIIATCAATLYSNGVRNISSASQAASALRPFAGEYAFSLFAIGIIGAGLLAVPILSGSAAYTMAESFRWKQGLYRKLKDAYAFYGVIIISMLAGLGLNFIGLDPIKMLIYSAVVNGLVAPVILFLIVRMTSRRRIMKDRPNAPITTFLGWFTTIIMAVAGIATIISLFI